jgi:hypothetical protein
MTDFIEIYDFTAPSVPDGDTHPTRGHSSIGKLVRRTTLDGFVNVAVEIDNVTAHFVGEFGMVNSSAKGVADGGRDECATAVAVLALSEPRTQGASDTNDSLT